MSTVAYPSPQFPGMPKVELSIPDDWTPVQAPGTTLAARAPWAENAFTANIVVNVEHREASFDVERALEELAVMAERRRGQITDPFRAEFNGMEYVGRELTWPDEQVGSITQAHLFHTIEPSVEGGAIYLVQLTGSVGGDNAAADYAQVQQAIGTVKVTPWSADGAGEQPGS